MEKLKESKIKLIDEEIAYLIEKKDDYSNEISEIATYFQDDIELTKLDIQAINDKRSIMLAIYDLIDDLEKLKIEIKFSKKED